MTASGTSFNYGTTTAGLLASRSNPFRNTYVKTRDDAGRATQIVTTVGSAKPLTEKFLEIGVKVDGAKGWKVYGPDSSGEFGDLQGIGGLEAVIRESGTVKVGIANDYFGNVVGTVPTAGGSFVWSQAQWGGYGPIPGSTVKTFKDSGNLEDVLAWKGRRVDETGFINMGARHYEPNGGRFLSPDPRGSSVGRQWFPGVSAERKFDHKFDCLGDSGYDRFDVFLRSRNRS